MAEIRFDAAGLRELFESPHGKLARDLARRAARVETQAKINATGREYGGFSGSHVLNVLAYVGERGPRVRTGRLRSSITWEIGHDSQGLFADIGTNVPYGRYLEFGTDRMRRYPFLGPALHVGLL